MYQQPYSGGGQMGGFSGMDPRMLALQFMQAGESPSQSIGLAQFLTQTGNYAPEPYSATQMQALGKLSDAESMVNQLDEARLALGPRGSGIGASIRGGIDTIGGQLNLNPEARYYNDYVVGVRGQLVKSLGESGALSDKDKADVMRLMPSISDSDEVAQMKMDGLRRRIAESRMSVEQYGGANVLGGMPQQQPAQTGFSGYSNYYY
jgi:hypothetical protein